MSEDEYKKKKKQMCTLCALSFSLLAARADHGTTGFAQPRGDEVRVRGREIAHAEEGAQATLARISVQPQQPGDARGRPFALPDASLRSRKSAVSGRTLLPRIFIVARIHFFFFLMSCYYISLIIRALYFVIT